jgi:hypothetical protein
MTQQFEVGDLVENVGGGCYAIVVDNKVGWVNGEWRVDVVYVDGPSPGERYMVMERVLRLVEDEEER